MVFGYFNLRDVESVLVVTDKHKYDIAAGIVSEIEGTNEVLLIQIPTGKKHGEEPPAKVAEMMKKFDVVVAPTTKSLSHTRARREATDAGVRMATMPGITKDIFERALKEDPSMKELTIKLKKELDKASEVRVKTEAGTDIRFSLRGRKAVSDYGDLTEPGSFDNLPSGEAFIAPLEDSLEGRMVVDASFGTGILRSPVSVKFSKGIAVDFEGEGSSSIRQQFEGHGDKGFTVAEFGIGTNTHAAISGNTLEDEKVKGTCHIALGNNMAFGGMNDVPVHVDGIMEDPTIELDGKVIMERGKFLI
ncbi:MAG: aminopeptidase [Nanobdellota archaeon]